LGSVIKNFKGNSMSKLTSRVAQIDTDKCVENAGGNRFMLVIMAAERAREIRRLNRHSDRHEHLHAPITALLEFQNGEIGPEYVKNVR
jgi:DNA-directed RNA polymerase subunit K/omega